MDQAKKYEVSFFNCKECVSDNSFTYPHAIMNPSRLDNGAYVREISNGIIIDANSEALDF
jgi:hypothetical protein